MTAHRRQYLRTEASDEIPCYILKPNTKTRFIYDCTSQRKAEAFGPQGIAMVVILFECLRRNVIRFLQQKDLRQMLLLFSIYFFYISLIDFRISISPLHLYSLSDSFRRSAEQMQWIATCFWPRGSVKAQPTCPPEDSRHPSILHHCSLCERYPALQAPRYSQSLLQVRKTDFSG